MNRFIAFFMGMFCFSSAVYADKQIIGDWVLDVGGGTSYAEAFTGNDSGSTFGLLCTSADCLFYIDMNLKCTEGGKIPMLINSSSGSTYISSTCVHLRSKTEIRYVTAIKDADVVTAISKGKVIGFAVPLESGQFKVVRFSLDGAVTATKEAVSRSKTLPAVRGTVLRDSTL